MKRELCVVEEEEAILGGKMGGTAALGDGSLMSGIPTHLCRAQKR